jgi:hypothetical protein
MVVRTVIVSTVVIAVIIRMIVTAMIVRMVSVDAIRMISVAINRMAPSVRSSGPSRTAAHGYGGNV